MANKNSIGRSEAVAAQMVSCADPSCRTKIIFARDVATGQDIPLDVSSPVYLVAEDPPGSGKFKCRRAQDFFVSHFKTCKSPEQFSRGKKASPGAIEEDSRGS